MRKFSGSILAAAAMSALFAAGHPLQAVAGPAVDDCDRLVRVPGDYRAPAGEKRLTMQAAVGPDAAAACRKAVAEESDNPRVMLQLAFALLYPTAVYFPDRTEEPPAEAWTYLSRAADREYPGAMFVMAQLVETGRFPQVDNPGIAWRMALSMYRKAAAGGNPAAMLRLAAEYSSFGGGLLRGGETGSDRDELNKSMEWANKAIDAGHPRAEIILARIVLVADAATDAERETATAALTRQMNAGDCDAYWALGSHLFKRGEPVSHGGKQTANPEALRLIRIAADGGHVTALRLMAGLYGPNGVYAPDPAEVEAWTKKAQAAQASGQATGTACKG